MNTNTRDFINILDTLVVTKNNIEYLMTVLGKQIETITEIVEKDKQYSNTDLLLKRIEDCGFSTRLENCLKAAEFYNIADIISCDINEFKKIRNLGNKAYLELVEFVKSNNLTFANNNINKFRNSLDYHVMEIKGLINEMTIPCRSGLTPNIR